MPKKTSAGILAYRQKDNELEVLLVHPGGPFWVKKDAGSWSIPKGEFDSDENPLQAAKREFSEETGYSVEGDFIRLDPVRQPSGKVIYCFAIEHDFDTSQCNSNTFTMEWPRRSGTIREFPEIDRMEWFTIRQAEDRISKGQRPILLQLLQVLREGQPISGGT
jgi:predicted NUDIX family NTP pyrophosphohydrolase